MQSPLSQAGPIEPFKVKTDVQHLEKLLNRIFGDEIEKTLEPGESNLIEFPQSPFKEEKEVFEEKIARAEVKADAVINSPEAMQELDTLIDFAPELFGGDDAPLKSIIEEDEAYLDSRLHQVVEMQSKELFEVRQTLVSREQEIKLYKLELAANADQLKYMPELFVKALQVNELSQELKNLQAAYELEQSQHEQCRDLLHKSQVRVDKLKSSFWFKLGRFIGLELG